MTKRRPLPPLDLNQRYTVPEALAYLRVSRRLFYQKVQRGELRLLKDGSRSFVPGEEIARNSRISTPRPVQPAQPNAST